MEISILVKGLFIGFAGAAVFGPISVIIIQRTLKRGWQSGFFSGAGVAVADGLYGLIGGLGLTAITSFMVGQQTWLRIIGGGVMILMGIGVIASKESNEVVDERKGKNLSFLGDFTSIFLLTISNPFTILYFAGVYAGIGLLGVDGGWVSAVYFSLGVTAGSMILWIILAGGVNKLSLKFNQKYLVYFSRLSGILIIILGIGILISIF